MSRTSRRHSPSIYACGSTRGQYPSLWWEPRDRSSPSNFHPNTWELNTNSGTTNFWAELLCRNFPFRRLDLLADNLIDGPSPTVLRPGPLPSRRHTVHLDSRLSCHPSLVFCVIYERIATKYNRDLVERHGENLSFLLIAVSSYPSLSRLVRGGLLPGGLILRHLCAPYPFGPQDPTQHRAMPSEDGDPFGIWYSGSDRSYSLASEAGSHWCTRPWVVLYSARRNRFPPGNGDLLYLLSWKLVTKEPTGFRAPVPTKRLVWLSATCTSRCGVGTTKLSRYRALTVDEFNGSDSVARFWDTSGCLRPQRSLKLTSTKSKLRDLDGRYTKLSSACVSGPGPARSVFVTLGYLLQVLPTQLQLLQYLLRDHLIDEQCNHRKFASGPGTEIVHVVRIRPVFRLFIFRDPRELSQPGPQNRLDICVHQGAFDRSLLKQTTFTADARNIRNIALNCGLRLTALICRDTNLSAILTPTPHVFRSSGGVGTRWARRRRVMTLPRC